MLITDGVCMGCGRPRQRARVDVSTLADAEPVHMPGRWDWCCGGMAAELAPCMGARQDVPVPTPADLLHHAGLASGLP